MKEGKLVFLKNLFLKARRRMRSKQDYQSFQMLQAEGVYRDLQAIFELDKVNNLIDLGCGKGGYAEVFSKYFDHVRAVDFIPVPFDVSSTSVDYINADVLEFRTSQKANMIFCASVIEHVVAPELLIETAHKALKGDGFLYLSFPPFHSLNGGHTVKPFHYLPEKYAIFIARKLGRVGRKVTSYSNLFGRWGLYQRNIGEVWELLERKGFRIIKCKPRYFDRDIRKGAFLSNFFTWHVEFYCEKII